MSSVTKDEIVQSFTDQEDNLNKQISVIETKILSVQRHILTLEQANQVIEKLAQSEKDPTQKFKYYSAIRNNVELLARLYEVVKEFENVKFKYFKEVDDVIYNKYRLIAVEIRRLEEKIDSGNFSFLEFFEKLAVTFSNPEQRALIKSDLEEKPEYRL